MNIDIKKETARVFPEVVEIRRYLHSHPELGEHEQNTSAYVCRVLDKLGIPYRSGIAGYGIVAQIGHGSRAVGIRADMDALPVTECTGLEYASKTTGVMHACGHDMHTSILLGTGMLLKSLESEIDAAGGAVKLFFQPAEETVGGAERMIKEGALEDPRVEAVIALHVDPYHAPGTTVLCYGPMNAQTQGFKLLVHGRSCHGAHPDLGVDAIVMASDIVLSLQTLSSRFNAPTTPVIVTIGTIKAGTAANIVAGEVEMRGTMRALTPEVMDANKKRFEELIAGVASGYGGSAEVIWASDGYPALINDDEVTDIVKESAAELFGPDSVATMKEPSLGGDDFAFFTKAVKGCYFNIGVTEPGAPVYALHNEHFAPSEEAMKTGIAVETLAALKLLGMC